MFLLGRGVPLGSAGVVAGQCRGRAWRDGYIVTLAGLGLGAVGRCGLPWAFDVIRWIGLCYLLLAGCCRPGVK